MVIALPEGRVAEIRVIRRREPRYGVLPRTAECSRGPLPG